MISWSQQHTLLLVLLISFIGFAAEPLYRHIYTLLALTGLYLLVRQYAKIIRYTEVRHFFILFMCIWLPMVLSLTDAEFFNRSADTTLRFITYLLAAITIIHYAHTKPQLHKLSYGVSGILLFMSIDGVLQWLIGSNLLGYPAYGQDQRIVGVFSPEPYLGLFLAIFSPIYFDSIRQLQARHKLAWLCLIPFILAIILAASRSAWLLLLIASGCYFIYFLRNQKQRNWLKLALQTGLCIAVLGLTAWQSDYIQQRVKLASHLFSADYEQANLASSYRLPLWETAINMSQSHYINGVGPRAYTLSYDQHAPEHDAQWKERLPTGHPHLYALEIAAETGLIGLLGYSLLLLLITRRLWQLASKGYHPAIPWGITSIIAIFPLSASMPFFGFMPAQIFWLSLTLFVALQNYKASHEIK